MTSDSLVICKLIFVSQSFLPFATQNSGNSAVSGRNLLPSWFCNNMTDIEQIASKIGISSGYLLILLYHHDHYYKTFYLKKRNSNKLRLIASPNYEIKAIQSWILRNYLSKVDISDRATGFVPKKNIKENAQFHLHQKYVMCLDIKDFFPTIKKDTIKKVIQEQFHDDFLAYFISELCTFKENLPQGGVTSPTISNIIFKPVDEKIKKIANEMNVNYSRYADDLCFSANYFNSLKDLKSKVEKEITDAGFTLNKDKSRFMTGKYKKIVTGLYLNSGKISVGRNYKRLIRSSLYNYYVKGDTNINLNSIYGMISFISGIENDYRKKIQEYLQIVRTKKLTF